MISRTPSPVGKRMQTPLLRPSKKFLEKKWCHSILRNLKN
jgi:hypothetical protein